MRAAHDDGVAGVVVAVGVGVAVAAVVLVGAAVVVVTLAALVVAAPVVAGPVVPASVALPVEHAATSDVRRSAAGRTARDGIRLGIVRP
jgi:hypothetical protein